MQCNVILSACCPI